LSKVVRYCLKSHISIFIHHNNTTTQQHITSHHITSHHISIFIHHNITTSQHHNNTSHHITSHHNDTTTSHHITSQHTTTPQHHHTGLLIADAGEAAARLQQKQTLLLHKSVYGLDALFLACQLGHVHQMFLLLRHGADVTTVDVNGDTPLHWALANEVRGGGGGGGAVVHCSLLFL
jgi:hypothetical protein